VVGADLRAARENRAANQEPAGSEIQPYLPVDTQCFHTSSWEAERRGGISRQYVFAAESTACLPPVGTLFISAGRPGANRLFVSGSRQFGAPAD